MHRPVHAEERAKNHCNCIGLKELWGPMEGGNFLQPLLGCTHSLVVERNGYLDSFLASLLRGSAVKNFLKLFWLFQLCHCAEYCTSGNHICFDFGPISTSPSGLYLMVSDLF